MSSEVQRLVNDLENDGALFAEAENLDPAIETTVAWANGKGYAFTVDELLAHIEEEKTRLSDSDLDAVAGGIGAAVQLPPGGGHSPFGAAIAIGAGAAIAGGGVAHFPGIVLKP